MGLDYKNVMENIPGIMFCAGKEDGTIKWLNANASKQTGFGVGDKLSAVFNDTLNFNDLQPEKHSIYKIAERWYAVGFEANSKEDFIMATGLDVTEMVSAGFVELHKSRDEALGIYDRKSAVEFLDSFIGRIEEDNMDLLTLAYIRLNDAPANVKESIADYVKPFTGVVINGIRETDIFAFMENLDFVILFPRCSFEVVENIITTIENKLNLLSAADRLDYGFEFEYSILEINKDNVAASETLFTRAGKMI